MAKTPPENTGSPGRPKGQPKTGGRKKGSLNKTTVEIKQAILNAFEKVGGDEYLAKVAKDEPRAFLQLLSKVMPMQIQPVLDEENTNDEVVKWKVEVVRAANPDNT